MANWHFTQLCHFAHVGLYVLYIDLSIWSILIKFKFPISAVTDYCPSHAKPVNKKKLKNPSLQCLILIFIIISLPVFHPLPLLISPIRSMFCFAILYHAGQKNTPFYYRDSIRWRWGCTEQVLQNQSDTQLGAIYLEWQCCMSNRPYMPTFCGVLLQPGL